MNDKPRKKIKNIRLAPGLWPSFCLMGESIDDDRFSDGTTIKTSKLIHIDFDKREAETLNTIYEF